MRTYWRKTKNEARWTTERGGVTGWVWAENGAYRWSLNWRATPPETDSVNIKGRCKTEAEAKEWVAYNIGLLLQIINRRDNL